MAESGGRCEWGQSVRRWEARVPGASAVWLEQRVQAWRGGRGGRGLGDRLEPGCGGLWDGGQLGWGAVGMKIYTFPTGVAGLLEASNFGGSPLGGVLALGCF